MHVRMSGLKGVSITGDINEICGLDSYRKETTRNTNLWTDIYNTILIAQGIDI